MVETRPVVLKRKKFLIVNTNLNKKPMSHIAHLRKQFKSINTYDYIITLIKRRKKNNIHFMKFIGSSFEKNLGKKEGPSFEQT